MEETNKRPPCLDSHCSLCLTCLSPQLEVSPNPPNLGELLVLCVPTTPMLYSMYLPLGDALPTYLSVHLDCEQLEGYDCAFFF